MNFGVNDSGDENASFEIDDLCRFRRDTTLADRDNLLPVYGDKTINDLPLRYNPAVCEY
jgi:hypothetical protein